MNTLTGQSSTNVSGSDDTSVISEHASLALILWKNKMRTYQTLTLIGSILGLIISFGVYATVGVVIGLAPAANGGNRTGKIFTGDSSGDWLIRALFEMGFANKPTSISKDDGLILKDAYLTAAAKCAPPQNKPNPSEITNCSQHLKSEIKILKTTKVIITLGRIAFNAYCNVCNVKGLKFGHNKVYPVRNGKTLIVSYHPSRRNTNTGTLTWQMWINIFETARLIINNK